MEPLPGALQSLNIPLLCFSISLTARSVFSFLETSITAMRLFKLKELAERTGKYPALFYTLETNPQQVLIAILIANCLTDVMNAALATYIMETLFAHFHLSSNLGFSFGIFVATMASLIFGEIIPKNVARNHGDKLFGSTLWLANLTFRLFYPLVTLLVYFTNFFIHLIGGSQPTNTSQWISSEKEIQFLIDYINEKGLMETEKTEMLQNIFELGHTPVKEILIPATNIVAVSAEATVNDILSIFIQRQFTRLPVYQDSPDNVIGMIHLKDVFALVSRGEKKMVKELLHPILFVPETLKVNQLLREFRQQHKHIAMVLNEHGIITGLITLEDVLEEIVGEISDEHEPTTEKVISLKNGSYLVDAGIDLEDLEKYLSITFETQGSVTLGGFLTEHLQHVPKKGERVVYQEFCFQVQKASAKRVISVLVFKDGTMPPEES